MTVIDLLGMSLKCSREDQDLVKRTQSTDTLLRSQVTMESPCLCLTYSGFVLYQLCFIDSLIPEREKSRPRCTDDRCLRVVRESRSEVPLSCDEVNEYSNVVRAPVSRNERQYTSSNYRGQFKSSVSCFV